LASKKNLTGLLIIMADTREPALVWGKEGYGDGEFQTPWGLAVSSDNVLYVSDSSNHRIQCFRCSDGTFLRKWGKNGSESGEFCHPRGLAISIDVCSSSQVLKVMKTVPVLSVFPPGVLPMCVAYLGTERLYVVDEFNHRIQVFDPRTGKFIHTWGKWGYETGDFYYPMACTASARDGSIHVLDSGNSRIQSFTPDGSIIREWSSSLTRETFISPKLSGLSVLGDCHGDLFYFSCGNEMGFSPDPLKASTWKKTMAGNLWSEGYGVTIAHDNKVYLTNRVNGQEGIDGGRVEGFQSDGTCVYIWHGTAKTPLDCPLGIVHNVNDNRLYVSDVYANRILVLNLSSSSPLS